MREIREQTERVDWPQVFKGATTWAERNHGGKIQADTVEQAEALITAELCEVEKVTHQQHPEGETGITTSSPLTYAQAAASPPTNYRGSASLIPPQVSVRPKNNINVASVQDQISKSTINFIKVLPS